MVGAWCFGCCQDRRGLIVGFPLLWYSFMCCWVLIFDLSPFYILIFMFYEIIHGYVREFHANQTSMCLSPHQYLRWGWYCETCLSPPIKTLLLTESRWCFFCWSFVIFMFGVGHAFLSFHCSLGKSWHLGSLLCEVLLCFVTFPYGVLGQVWNLIVSIPDFCFIIYFYNTVLV